MSMIRENKIFVVFGGALLVVGIGWLLNYFRDTCELIGFENRAGMAELGCFEFWLFRYQTLITGGFAALAAFAALKQLKAARQQGAAAVQQSSLTSFEFWSARFADVTEMERIADEITTSSHAIFRVAYTQKLDEEQKITLAKMDESIVKFRKIYDKYIWAYAEKPTDFIRDADSFVTTSRDIDAHSAGYRTLHTTSPSIAILKKLHESLCGATSFGRSADIEMMSIEENLHNILRSTKLSSAS